MFGVFQGGQSGTNKSSLPKLGDLVIAYEAKPGLELIPGPTPNDFNYVTRITNTAPNFVNQYNSVHNLGTGSTTRYFLPGSQTGLFGTVGGFVRTNNSANQYFTPTDSFTVGSTGGFTVVMTHRPNVSGTDFAWQLNAGGTGEDVSGYFGLWNDSGTNRWQFDVVFGTKSTTWNSGWASNQLFRNFHAFTMDFTGAASGAELYVSDPLGTTGGAFVSRDTELSSFTPDSNYTFQLLSTTGNRPAFDFQSLYVWRTKLTSGEITEVQNYLNNVYIPTI